MGVKERKREKSKSEEATKTSEKVKPEPDKVLEDTELEEITHTPEVVVEAKESTATVEPEQV
ncbi:MAG: hypothetical protein ACW96M_00765, partial [Candidatus Thorarchaeota archaeon]